MKIVADKKSRDEASLSGNPKQPVNDLIGMRFRKDHKQAGASSHAESTPTPPSEARESKKYKDMRERHIDNSSG